MAGRRTIISIHALARRATVLFRLLIICIYISIHALARRATRYMRVTKILVYISIHALARRATCISILQMIATIYFNPRSRKESDCLPRYAVRDRGKFQSTLSQGERHESPAVFRFFNHISIHALARRATRNQRRTRR